MQRIPKIMMTVLMVLSVTLNFAPSDAQMIDPYFVSLTLHMEKNQLLRLYSTNTTSEISLEDPTQSVISTDNLLAYYPEFKDRHNSGLGGIFINIEGIFPCTADLHKRPPVIGPSCKLFTNEEDGFNGGRAIIELGDAGTNELQKVFGPGVALYGLAFSGCPTITSECFPLWFRSEIVCAFPRSICP